MGPLRVDQLLSRFGYCSRSQADAWVRSGRVTHKGVPVRRTTERVAVTEVLIDGEAVDGPKGILAILHKPTGTVCSHDTREGPTVYDLLPAQWLRRNPPVTSVGRLDRDTTGLLLITDLGELVHRWTSPRHHVEKVYEVQFEGSPPEGLIELFAAGTLRLEGEAEPCRPARLEWVGKDQARVILTEGRYHQVRRMFAAVGLHVVRLHRSRFGDFTLGTLPPGEWLRVPLPLQLPRQRQEIGKSGAGL